MNQITHPPVKEALQQLKDTSSDEETRYQTQLREQALFFERIERHAIEERSKAEGEAIGEANGIAKANALALQRLVESGMTEAQAKAILHL